MRCPNKNCLSRYENGNEPVLHDEFPCISSPKTFLARDKCWQICRKDWRRKAKKMPRRLQFWRKSRSSAPKNTQKKTPSPYFHLSSPQTKGAGGNPALFPPALFVGLFRIYARPGETALQLFGGSGRTSIRIKKSPRSNKNL